MKSENCLLALHHINQCLPLNLRNLLTTENDLHNYSTQNSVNQSPAACPASSKKPPTMDYILIGIGLLNTGTLYKIV